MIESPGKLVCLLSILAVIAAAIEAQKPPRQKAAPRKNTVVVGAADAATLRKVLREENWIGRLKLAPARLALARDPSNGALKSITTVLADDIELRGQNYQMKRGTAPRNVLLIADRIRISGPTTFDLSGWSSGENKRGIDLLDRSGGDLVLLARTLDCGPNGKLDLRSTGGRGLTKVTVRDHRSRPPNNAPLRGNPRRQPSRAVGGGGHGGDLIIGAERFLLGGRLVTWEQVAGSGCLRLSAAGGTAGSGIPAGKAGKIRPFESIAAALTALDQGAVDKNFLIAKYQPAVSRWARHATSKWVLESLSQAILDVRSAGLGAGPIEALRRLRPALELVNPGLYPVRLEDRPAYEERLVKLQELRGRFDHGLLRDTLAVGVPGSVPRNLELFTEGRDLKTRVAPTEALLLTRVADGRQVLGLIEFDPEQPDLLRLEVEVKFTVDPWLAALATRELTARGEEYGGAFSHWTLAPRPLSARGIRDSAMEVWPSGDGARVLLTVESDLASLVMSRLASSSGLPLDFSWEYRDDRGFGEPWRGPSLSLLRRADTRLAVAADGTVSNRGGIAVTLEYVELSGEYHPLNPAISLAPGESATLPLPAGAEASGLRIPAEAVFHTGMDPFRFDGDFKIVNGEELIEKIVVTNLLGYDEPRGGALKWVEVDLAYGGGEGATAVAGPYRLASFGAEGSEMSFSFVKSRRGKRQLLLSGAAHYEGGGCQTLIPTTFEELSVKITESLLPSLDGELATGGPADIPSRCPAGG